MSKCHMFSVDDAIEHGVEKAVIIQNLRFWLEKVKGNDKDGHKHDGYYWTYNSARAFAEIFPYFNKSKVHRLLTQLEDDGIIMSGNFNKAKYDRTKWYSMPEFSISNKQNFQVAEVKDESLESATPIPYVITDSNPDVITNTKVTKEKVVEPRVKFSPTKPNDVSSQTWIDLLQLRKTKRAVESQTAWTRINNAIERAQQATGHSLEDIYSYWVMRAWSGFDDKWYVNAHPKQKAITSTGNNGYERQSDYSDFTQSVQQQLMQQFEREDAQETDHHFGCRDVYPMED